MSINEKILEKKALNQAQNYITKISGIQFLNYDTSDSIELNMYRKILSEFNKIESLPVSSMIFGDTKENYIKWISNYFATFKKSSIWSIMIPGCFLPIWANVNVIDFNIAIESLWNYSLSVQITIVDKKNGIIGHVFAREYEYALYVKDKVQI